VSVRQDLGRSFLLLQPHGFIDDCGGESHKLREKQEMPHPSRGFWCCDYCKLTLDSAEDAKQHEDEECQQNPNRQQQEQEQQQPKHHTLQQQHFQPAFFPQPVPQPHQVGYYPPIDMAPVPRTASAHNNTSRKPSFPLMGINESSNMNADDYVACQSLEVFEAGKREISDEELRSQTSDLELGQLGLRCIHCSSSPESLSEATYFPASAAGRESMAEGVRLLSERHLRKCNMAPASVRDINQQATKKRRSHNKERDSSWQDDERSRSALRNWCFRFCQRLGIVGKGPNNRGLVFIQHPGNNLIAPMPVASMPRRTRTGMPGQVAASTPMARRRPLESGDYHSGYETYDQGSEEHDFTQDASSMYTPGNHPPMGPPPQQPGMSPHRGYHQQHQIPSFGVPGGDFPFYQEAVGTWACRYCSHVPPHYRDPQAMWASPNGMPPPPHYVDQHLNMCRAYHQHLQNQPMFHASPQFAYTAPPFPGSFGAQPVGWEAPGPGVQGNQGQHMPFAYAQGSHDNTSSAQRQPISQSPYSLTQHQVTGVTEFGDAASRGMMSQPRTQIASSASLRPDTDASVRRAIDYLTSLDREATYAESVAAGGATEQLVLEEDKLLLTDYFFYLMKQLRLCRFSESDRKTRGGKREKILLGFGGLQCIHCSDANNSRKFFWSNVDRLANSFAEIPGHILKCRHCPRQTKDALYQLKQLHPEQMARLPRGSQKVFFRRMWRRLHDEDPQQAGSPEQASPPRDATAADASISATAMGDTKYSAEAKASGDDFSPSGTSGSDESILLMQRSTKEAAKALADSLSMGFPPSPTSRVLLAIPEDKEWLSDTDCFIRRQIEVFCATREDVDVARSDRKFPVHESQVGIRCIHCALAKRGLGARGSAVSYPFSMSGIYESVREFQRLHLDSCENVPGDLRTKLSDLKGSTSLSSVLRKYYILAAKALGLQDTREGIRAGADSVPIGSQAAFAFNDSTFSISDEMRRSADVPTFAEVASPSLTPAAENRKRKSDRDTPDSSESSKRPHSP
jgi:hypothetical protein